MLSNLILAYPKLSEADYKRIQSIRSKHDDRYYGIVEPHFTIVFPVFNYNVSLLSEHVKNLSSGVEPIEFTLRCTTIVKDSFSEYTDVFLVPDEGNSELIKLHDRMYTGLLRDELRLDIPFIPHIGIGASRDPVKAKNISDSINSEEICIKGIIDELVLVEYEYPKLYTIDKFILK